MAAEAWSYYETLTLLSYYKALQERIIHVYEPYSYVVERYSQKVQREVHPITEEYLKNNPQLAEQNVALLKNAMELWRAASIASEAVSPILYHYSWHLFNGFFAYTFFRWEPEHAKGHGVRVPSEALSENVGTIKLKMQKEKERVTEGLFWRLIDTWTLLGSYSAFSSSLPVFGENEEIDFAKNDFYLLENTSTISVERLLSLDVGSFANSLRSHYGGDRILNCLSIPTISMHNETIQDFLIAFVASSLARYRPIIWNSVILGDDPARAQLAYHSRRAFIGYTVGHGAMGLLYQIRKLFADIVDRKFKIYKRK